MFALTPNAKRQLKAPIFPNIIAQLATVSEASTTRRADRSSSTAGWSRSRASKKLFNPAPGDEVNATALVALKSFGPYFRFETMIWTNGVLDPSTGTIDGDLFLSGRDPALHDEHVVIIARELNRLGIRTVTGDLYVPSSFSLNFDASAKRAAGDSTIRWTRRCARPQQRALRWQRQQQQRQQQQPLRLEERPTTTSASVAVMGDVYIGDVTPDARPLLTHKSSALVDILKVLLCYSNNFMADRLGDSLGGPRGIERSLITQLGIRDEEINVASASGLGSGRVTPAS
ncbi:MAG: D-alanyl-D-alanine carboxypeptidase [Pyrinomonadaceae bacterium]